MFCFFIAQQKRNNKAMVISTKYGVPTPHKVRLAMMSGWSDSKDFTQTIAAIAAPKTENLSPFNPKPQPAGLPTLRVRVAAHHGTGARDCCGRRSREPSHRSVRWCDAFAWVVGRWSLVVAFSSSVFLQVLVRINSKQIPELVERKVYE